MTGQSPQDPVLGRAAGPSDQIDTFPVEGPLEVIVFETSELLAICPVTDGPDVYDATISYTPTDRCIESKSLKLYLETFRNIGVFAEHLAPRISAHLGPAVGVPVSVELRQHTRGGIVTTVRSTISP